LSLLGLGQALSKLLGRSGLVRCQGRANHVLHHEPVLLVDVIGRGECWVMGVIVDVVGCDPVEVAAVEAAVDGLPRRLK
jgi:hypothetical protein